MALIPDQSPWLRINDFGSGSQSMVRDKAFVRDKTFG